MQRWMLFAGLGAVGLVLMFFGARFAKSEYHLGQPSKMWVQLPLRPELPMAEQDDLADRIREKLRTDEILRKVVVEVGLQQKFGSPTEDAAVKELGRRLFVDVGTAKAPSGVEVPSLNIGVSGTGHEKEILGEASAGLFNQVLILIGIDPATGKPIDQSAPVSR